MPSKPAHAPLAKALSRLRSDIALNRDFNDLHEAALLAFAHTWQRLEQAGRAFFSSHGVSDVQFNVLMILWDYRDEAPLRQHRLAEMLVINRASAGALIDRMERDGLLARKADPQDRRARLVRLTPKGAATLRALRGPYYALVAQMMGALSTEQLSGHVVFMDLLRARLSALDPTAVQ
ncbi:MAG: MarR family transcriptional regulator [Proteobacteria bacterium]|nr:MarR family transcriptional regulator [Pseudomonadota bacterium]